MPERVRRVALLLRDPASSSSRVRLLQYRSRFADVGIEVRTLGWNVRTRAEVGRYAAQAVGLVRWADVAVLHKPAQPTWLLRMLARARARLVVDLDDAVWVAGSGRRTTASGRLGERLRVAMQLADQVIAGSEWLATRLRQMVPEATVTVIRPSVDMAAYRSLERPASAVATIGWVGSPGNLADFGSEARAGIGAVVEAGRARLVLLTTRGTDPAGLPGEVVPWSLTGEASVIAGFDIGVMPLNADERSAGRCGYKAVQYLAASRPVVASEVGCAGEIVRPGCTGILARTASEWERGLLLLIDDPGERARLGGHGRRWVGEEASLDLSFVRLSHVLERAR